jgi:hypothetical protein
MIWGPLYKSYHIQNSKMAPFPQHPKKNNTQQATSSM